MRTWFHFVSFENMKKPYKFMLLYYINALNRNLLPDTYLYYGIVFGFIKHEE